MTVFMRGDDLDSILKKVINGWYSDEEWQTCLAKSGHFTLPPGRQNQLRVTIMNLLDDRLNVAWKSERDMADVMARVGNILGIDDHETHIDVAKRFVAGTQVLGTRAWKAEAEVQRLRKLLGEDMLTSKTPEELTKRPVLSDVAIHDAVNEVQRARLRAENSRRGIPNRPEDPPLYLVFHETDKLEDSASRCVRTATTIEEAMEADLPPDHRRMDSYLVLAKLVDGLLVRLATKAYEDSEHYEGTHGWVMVEP